MAIKTVSIGSAVNVYRYDDAVSIEALGGPPTKSIIVEQPISQSVAPVDPNDLLRLMDIVDIVTNANSISTSPGTVDAGDINSIEFLEDADSYDVSEVVGAPGFITEVTFTGLTTDSVANAVEGHYSYNGNHTIRLEIWNYTGTPAWDLIDDTTFTDTGGVLTWFSVAIPGTVTDYMSGGETKVRINHAVAGNITHDFILDYFSIKRSSGVGGGVTDHGSLAGLGDNDHLQYMLLADYTELTDWLDDVTLGNDGQTAVPQAVLVPRATALNDIQGGMYYSSVDDSIYVCTSDV